MDVNEAPKDPGVCQQRYTEQDYEGNKNIQNKYKNKCNKIKITSGHRAHSVFVGVHTPGNRRHSHRRHKHHHKDGERINEYERPSKCVFVYLFNPRVCACLCLCTINNNKTVNKVLVHHNQ